MAFSSSDLEAIEAAIVNLATGSVAEEVQIGSRRRRLTSVAQAKDLYEFIEKRVTLAASSGVVKGTFSITSNQDDD